MYVWAPALTVEALYAVLGRFARTRVTELLPNNAPGTSAVLALAFKNLSVALGSTFRPRAVALALGVTGDQVSALPFK